MGGCISISVSADRTVSDCQNFLVGRARYKTNLQNDLHVLQRELDRLIEKKNDVMTRVNIAEQQPQMQRLEQVNGWFSRVQVTETQVAELKAESSQEIDGLCLGGSCSKTCNLSRGAGERVAKMLKELATLKEEGDFDEVADWMPNDPVDERPFETTIIGTESTFNDVWRCLGVADVGIIGLYGMGGVGKSTLLDKINNKLRETPNDFAVIRVTLTRNMQLEQFQERIGQKMGLYNESWKNKSLEDKTSDIFRILSRKKFVLLLDNIWERIDLTEAGIPLPNSGNGSKIVFTTRLVGLCGLMEAQEKFKVECLTDEQAWELFASKVGDRNLNNHPEIRDVAKIVAKVCGGLPLALVTVARAMACKTTPEEWEYAVDILRRLAHEFSGMEDNVFRLLKFSYDSLLSDTVRSCFVYCSLFPENYRISRKELIDCWISEGLLDDRSTDIQNEGYDKIGVLLNTCLLEETEDGHIKMHDVIRDMALWVVSKVEKEKHNYFVDAGMELSIIPEVKDWEGAKKVSLMENQIEHLTEIPNCPNLITLFLNNNHLLNISGGYFQCMPSLKVLNLSNNSSLSELPTEISELNSLQHLDLSRTAIKELPKELESLVELECLNLEHTNQLQRIPRQLISKFSKLKVLRMWECGNVVHWIKQQRTMFCLTMLNL
ncbi:hypothetical protein ACOSQ2_020040 [Xanthoceras sorbifolium]